ncbi:MAG TPA: hypothetical protein VFW62_08155, partial [bacterium]|nr:hypothetical protein [bacterium]
MLQPVDSSILHEIVRIIEARRKVPEKLQVRGREYQITYLEDHQRRLEEALHRFDSDQLNMLYGQLASKVKYQMLRRVPAKPVKAPARKPAAGKSKERKAAAKAPAKPKSSKAKAPKRVARKTSAKKTAKKVAKKKAPARKPGGKKTGA